MNKYMYIDIYTMEIICDNLKYMGFDVTEKQVNDAYLSMERILGRNLIYQMIKSHITDDLMRQIGKIMVKFNKIIQKRYDRCLEILSLKTMIDLSDQDGYDHVCFSDTLDLSRNEMTNEFIMKIMNILGGFQYQVVFNEIIYQVKIKMDVKIDLERGVFEIFQSIETPIKFVSSKDQMKADFGKRIYAEIDDCLKHRLPKMMGCLYQDMKDNLIRNHRYLVELRSEIVDKSLTEPDSQLLSRLIQLLDVHRDQINLWISSKGDILSTYHLKWNLCINGEIIPNTPNKMRMTFCLIVDRYDKN